jgi:CubicO group peptidase (beta-lactamase class C family)
MGNTITPAEAGLSAERLGRLDTVMRRSVERESLAGAVTILARRGRVAHVGCYGYMDLASQEPMREDAIFRIFSMTKPITSLAVLMLHEEGRFHLNTPVSSFIPAFKSLKVAAGGKGSGTGLADLARQVTIHDLLTHTSGLGYGLDPSNPVEARFLEAGLLDMDEPMADKIPRLAAIPLHHQPGLRYTYSMATDVLGYLVELVSGLPLDEFFRTRIFGPLGMTDTDFFVPAEKRGRLATLYTDSPEGGLVDMAKLDPALTGHFMKGAWIHKDSKPRFLSGGGGLVSTAADYLRFALMLRTKGELEGQRLVGRKTMELMTAPCLRQDQFGIPGCSYGLGVTVLTDPALLEISGSAGGFGGGGAANTDFWVDPREDLIGILMVQYATLNPCQVSQDFKAMAMQAIVD